MMSKLAVKCIQCNKTWEKDSVIDWGPEDYTGSLCDGCFVKLISPTIRKKQLREGNFDCFGKAVEFCDQGGCKYKDWCLRQQEAGKGKNGEEA